MIISYSSNYLLYGDKSQIFQLSSRYKQLINCTYHRHFGPITPKSEITIFSLFRYLLSWLIKVKNLWESSKLPYSLLFAHESPSSFISAPTSLLFITSCSLLILFSCHAHMHIILKGIIARSLAIFHLFSLKL